MYFNLVIDIKTGFTTNFWADLQNWLQVINSFVLKEGISEDVIRKYIFQK